MTEVGKKSLRVIIRLVLIAMFLTPPVTQAGDANGLRFEYRPAFAIHDLRIERPAGVESHPSFTTYYLVDNGALFHLHVSLLNVGDRPIPLGGETRDWANAIEARLWRDGDELSVDVYSIAVAEQMLRQAEYLRAGVALEKVELYRAPDEATAIVTTPFDELREIRTPFKNTPPSLAPFESLEFLLTVTRPDRSPLPQGHYEIQLTYRPPANPNAWEGNPPLSFFRQMVVIGAPRSDLDLVDNHLVRAALAKRRGDRALQREEIENAVAIAPRSIKAWQYLAGFLLEEAMLEEALGCFEMLRSLVHAVEAGEGEWEERGQKELAGRLDEYVSSLRESIAETAAQSER